MPERTPSLCDVAAACAAADTPAELRAAIRCAVLRFGGTVAHLYRPAAPGLQVEEVTATPSQSRPLAGDHPILAGLPAGADVALAGDRAARAALMASAVGQDLLAPAGAVDELLLRLGPLPSSAWLGIGLAAPGDRDRLLPEARLVRALLADAKRHVLGRELDHSFAVTAARLLERRGRLVLVADAEGRLQGIDGAPPEADGASPVPEQLLRALERVLAREHDEDGAQETEISVPGPSGEPVRARVLARRTDGGARAIVIDLPRRPTSPEDLGRLGLSGRQAEVLALILSGATTSAVGNQLGISSKTAQKHLEQAYRRLGANSRLEALTQVLEAV